MKKTEQNLKNTLKSPKSETSKITEKNPNKTLKTEQRFKLSLRFVLEILAYPVWVYVATIIVEYAIIFGLYFLIGRAKLTTPVWTTIANTLVYSIALIIIIYLPQCLKKSKYSKPSRNLLGLSGLPTWADMLLAPACFLAFLILAGILESIFSMFPFFDISEAQDVGYNLLSNGTERLVAFFALVVVAPVAEEVIFRGWLYGNLRKKIPGKKLSLILSILIVSVLFGFMHGQWNVGVSVFAMSIILCLMRETTGTIYSGILLHMLKNAVAFALLYIFNFSF